MTLTRQRHRPSLQAIGPALADLDLAPEQRAAALMLSDAITACQDGDGTACEWLARCAEVHVIALAGDAADCWLERIRPLIENVQLSVPLGLA